MLNTLKLFEIDNTKINLNYLRFILPSIILLTFYFSEFISKYLKFNHFEFTRVSGIVKLVVEILLLAYLFKYKKKFGRYLIRIIGLFLLFYICGQFFLIKANFLTRVVLNLYSLNSYIFIFILYYSFKPQLNSEINVLNKQLTYLNYTVKSIFIINAFAIVLGLIFNLDLFKTYIGFSNRFGYNGLFLHASHSSYIYIIFIIYFFASYLNNKTRINFGFLLFAMITSLLIGTKTIYLFNSIFLLYLLYAFVKRIYALIFLSVIGILIILTFSNVVHIFKENFAVLYKVYENHGLLTMLFSYRNLNVTEEFLPYIKENWSVINYLFGGAEFNQFRSEIEIVDLFWFLGILGTFAYLKLFYNKILYELISIKALKLPIIIFLFCALLSGSFFTNVPIVPYIVILYYTITISYYNSTNQ